MELLLIGEVRNLPIGPSLLSQIMLTPENIAVKRLVMTRTPPSMKVM
jgi:hypothetical protein